MHTSVRGIVNYKNKIVLIHRIKTKDDGTIRDYYVIPGGKIEENESHEEALRREIKEELGIEIEIKDLCLELDDRDYNDSFQYFYNCNFPDDFFQRIEAIITKEKEIIDTILQK